VTVDTAPSHLTSLTPSTSTVQQFAPNGDGYRDTVALSATNSEVGSFTVRVRNGDGTLIKKWSVTSGTIATSVTWDGRDAAGHVVPDGDYVMRVSPVDAYGNTGVAAERTVRVVAGLKGVATSRATTYPQDGDGLARTTNLSFTLLRPMTVTWTLRNAAGDVVDTHLDAADLGAGLHSWVFAGLTTAGDLLPTGRYISTVTATDGTLVTSQSVAFTMDGFIVSASDSTPGRGQKISVWAVTTETLAAAPRLYIIQPGKAVWSVPMVKTVTHTYKAIITLKTGGSSGTVSFKVLGKDTLGGVNRALKAYPLH
jgi:flagellar hook assembly protein FlgD